MKTILLRQCINRIPGFIFILVLLIQPGKFNAQCLEDISASGPSSSSGDPCNNYFHEESTTFYPEGIIYLNFHFIRDEDGERNFDENGDNNSNPNDGNYSGIRIANEILEKLNIITRDAMLLDPVLPGNKQNKKSNLIFVPELVAFFKTEGFASLVKKAPNGKPNLPFFAFSRSAYGVVHIRTIGEKLLVFTSSGKCDLKKNLLI